MNAGAGRTVASAALLVGLVGAGCSDDAAQRATRPTCGDDTGRTETIELPNQPELPGRDAVIHLPPCYDQTDAVYPTVYLLHGAGMLPERFLLEPIFAGDAADGLAVEGLTDPMILVMPPRSIMRGGFTDRVLDPLIMEVDDRYRTIGKPEGRAVGGFSASGPAVAQSGFVGPRRFDTVAFFAVTFSESVGPELAEGADERMTWPEVFIEVGDRDRLQSRVPVIEAALAPFGVEPEVSIVPGNHSLDFVADRVDDWLVEFDDRIGRALAP